MTTGDLAGDGAVADPKRFRRLAAGTAANFLGKIWILLVQLITIPVLTAQWGSEGYGSWLLLITIPSFVSLSDLGLGNAAGVDITVSVSRGDYNTARVFFQSVWGLLTGLTSIVTAVICAIAVYQMVVADSPQDTVFAGALLAMALCSFIAVQMNILLVVYGATHKYAVGSYFMGGLVPIEGAALCLVALLGGDILAAALAWLVVRSIGAYVFLRYLQRREPWLEFGWSRIRLATIRHLIEPSMASFALTVAMAISLQGTIVTLGLAAGAAVVAVFGSVRLLTRIPLQFSGLLTRASVPELTRAHTSNDHGFIGKMMRWNLWTSMAATVPAGLILAIAGPPVLLAISHGELDAGPMLFAALAAAAALNAIWMALATPLIATNRQGQFAYAYAIFGVLPVVAPLLPFADRAMAAAIGMVCAELATFCVVLLADGRLRRTERAAT